VRTNHGLCYLPEGRGITVRENLVLQAASVKRGRAIAVASETFPILAND